MEKNMDRTRKWLYALCQHPMWLIIDQDTVCAERTPPWGAASIEDYADRLRRNLAALSKYPDLKLNFDSSGVELDDIAKRYPDILEQMREFVKTDRLTFLNGTYSQPHLQNFGLESMIRQFEYGMEVYQHLLKFHVNTYAAQEVGITEQLPQVLAANRFMFAVVPHFSWAITFLTPHEVVGYEDHLEPVHGREFTFWQGLDKSEIPLYITQVLFHHGITDDAIESEIVRDLYQGPPIKAFTPDLIEVDDKMIKEQLNNGKFVLLDKALADRIKKVPPASKARFYTYWSYVEGIDAEALSRANLEAENSLIQAEIVDAFVPGENNGMGFDFSEQWKKILKCQHHDAYWAGAPELRQKSMQWLNEVTGESKEFVQNRLNRLSNIVNITGDKKSQPIFVFTTYAKPQPLIGKISLPKKMNMDYVLKDNAQSSIPCQILPGKKSGKLNDIMFLLDSQGVGYTTYHLVKQPQNKPTEFTIIKKPLHWSNQFYQAVILPDGTFSSLQVAKTKRELLNTKIYRGNELKGLFNDTTWLSSKNSGVGKMQPGQVADIVITQGKLERTPFEMKMFLYHQLPWFDIELTFDFQDTSIGMFWDDETKLNLYWPMAGENEIYHGIGGGTVKSLSERPIFAINWVDMVGANGSLTLLNHGTLKQWVRDNVLAMVIGWGHKGNKITNRRPRASWSKSYDFRLKGEHMIRYSIYPHVGDWKKANIPDWAIARLHPPIAITTQAHKGILPAATTYISIPEKNLIPTSIRRIGNRRFCRAYESFGESGRIRLREAKTSRIKGVRNLAGKSISEIKPFQIAEVEIKL
jgi:hypothetical protein